MMKRASLRQEPSLGTEENQHQSLEKIIFAQELERRKWALEVHDGITQSLVNIYYRLQGYRKVVPKDRVKAQLDLDEIEDLVQEAISEARGIIDALRPSILDDVGLIPAIERYIRRGKEKNKLSISFEVKRPIPRLSSEVETVIFRIVQEALSNIRKHAKATEVKVEIDALHNRVMAKVADNGRGFDVKAVDTEGDNWGLIGMRERAEIIGSSLEIQSAIGEGTTVSLDVPIVHPKTRLRHEQMH